LKLLGVDDFTVLDKQGKLFGRVQLVMQPQPFCGSPERDLSPELTAQLAENSGVVVANPRKSPICYLNEGCWPDNR